MPSTHNNVWGSAPEGDETEEMQLPSGQTCTAKRVSINDMIEMGILSEADSLTALVEKHTRKVKGGNGTADHTEVNNTSLLKDGDAMRAIITLADSALPSIVVDPPVALHYKQVTVGKTTVQKKLTDEDRAELRLIQPALIFTDQIGLDDKMHLFSWGVGGLSTFLAASGGSTVDVGNVGTLPSGKKATKRRPRSS